MIIDEIKKANIEAMKARDSVKRNIIGIVLNKYMLLSIEKKAAGKVADDADMTAILTKTVKELTEESENYKKVGNTKMEGEILAQKAFVEQFLPVFMSEDEIKNIILSQSDKSVPAVMKLFKSEYAGKCDMKQVSEVLKQING